MNPRARFPAAARLKKPAEFDASFSAGRRCQAPPLMAVVAPGVTGVARLGFALSKKTAPRAVDRNRIKRVARESFRRTRADLPPRDIVLLGRPGCAKADAARLRAALQVLWTQVAAC